MKVITPLIKALKLTTAKWTFANEFDDFLAKPDTPYPEVYAGSKVTSELVLTATGKKFVLDALPGKSKKEVKLITELAKLFAGADMTYVIGYHEKNLADLMKINESIAGMVTPDGLRTFIAGITPVSGESINGVPHEEAGPFVEAGTTILDKLESIESISIENVDLPVRFAQNGLPATVGATLTCKSVKPFALMKYLAEPTLEKVKAGAANC